jgi:hypothetical protein
MILIYGMNGSLWYVYYMIEQWINQRDHTKLKEIIAYANSFDLLLNLHRNVHSIKIKSINLIQSFNFAI